MKLADFLTKVVSNPGWTRRFCEDPAERLRRFVDLWSGGDLDAERLRQAEAFLAASGR